MHSPRFWFYYTAKLGQQPYLAYYLAYYLAKPLIRQEQGDGLLASARPVPTLLLPFIQSGKLRIY